MAKTKEKVADAAGTAKPYVDRALHDEELRDNVKTAFAAAREIYSDLAGRGGVSNVAQKVATDRDIHENLRTAIEELRHAANRLQGKAIEEERKGRNGMLLLIGIVLGILFNPVTGPSTRGWLKSKVSGGGSDEFGYQSSTGNGTS